MKKLFKKMFRIRKESKQDIIEKHHNELILESKFYRDCNLEDKRFLLSLHSNKDISLLEIKNLIIDDELSLELEERELLHELMYTNVFKWKNHSLQD